MSWLQKLDAFPKAVSDVTERSRISGIISIISLTIIAWMIYAEFHSYMTTEMKFGLGVDGERTLEQGVKIYVNMLIATKCEYLSADVVDVSGEHYGSEVTHDLLKTPEAWAVNPVGPKVDGWWREFEQKNLNFGGLGFKDIIKYGTNRKFSNWAGLGGIAKKLDAANLRSSFEKIQGMPPTASTEEIKAKMPEPMKLVPLDKNNSVSKLYNKSATDVPLPTEDELKYGLNSCRISGTVTLSKVKTNFHITAGKTVQTHHGHRHDLSSIPPGAVNFTHVTNRLVFGNRFPGLHSPLEGVHQHTTSDKAMYSYYIKIVPTHYVTDDLETSANQYAVTYSKRTLDPGRNAHGLPGLFFTFDYGAIALTIEQKQGNFFHFLTQLCAIVGGVYAVSGMISSMLGAVPRMLKPTKAASGAIPFN